MQRGIAAGASIQTRKAVLFDLTVQVIGEEGNSGPDKIENILIETISVGLRKTVIGTLVNL